MQASLAQTKALGQMGAMMTSLPATLLSGRTVPFRDTEHSAIAKTPITGEVVITALGIAGDQQADKIHHGGPDKALHHYPADHYDHWQQVLGAHPDLIPGGFGENISTLGLTEADVLLGDRFRLGTALIEVSHGRQPCWKLAHRFGVPGLVAQVVKSGRAGWYTRVLEPGVARTGDRLELTERGLPEWTMARLFHVLIGGGHKQDPAALTHLANLPVLAEDWHRRARELSLT